MPSPAAPLRLTPASISPAQPSAPSVTNTTATASSPSFAGNDQASGPSSKPASLFSSLLSTATKPKLKPQPKPFKPAAPPSVASSSVSVSVSTTATPRDHPAPTSTTASTSTSTTTPSTTSRTTTTATHPPPTSSAPTTLPSPPLNAFSYPHPHHQPQDRPPQQVEISQARSAVLASIGNLLDRELTTRASLLHANNAAIEKQERDVAKATEGLKRENDKLGKLAAEHTRKVKEIGNVQNWAEMLEREFVILEETLRLVDDGDDEGSEGSWSGSGSEWEDGDEEGEGDIEGEGSGEGRREDGEGVGERRDGEGDVVMGDGPEPEMVPLPVSPPGERVGMD